MTWRIEARLVAAKPDGDHELPVGGTTSSTVVLAIADALLAEAEQDASWAETIDPVLGLVARSEVEKLRSVIEHLVPEPPPLQIHRRVKT